MSADFWDDLAGDDFRRVPEGEKGAGSPLIIPEGGGEPVRYARFTNFIGAAEDDYGIAQWKRNLTVDGTLLPEFDADEWREADWKEKKRLSHLAFVAAGGEVKANNGTRMHELTEDLDHGRPLRHEVTAQQQADLDAYADAVRHLTPRLIEPRMVYDPYGAAGTPDRLWDVPGESLPLAGDLKSGKIDGRKCAMQMALAVKAKLYDVRTGKRTDFACNQEKALILHLPYGEARARVLEVDLVAGWEGVQLCAAVHAWRKRNGMTKAWTAPAVDYVVLAQAAGTVDELMALHARAVADDAWNHVVRSAFGIRKAQITAADAA